MYGNFLIIFFAFSWVKRCDGGGFCCNFVRYFLDTLSIVFYPCFDTFYFRPQKKVFAPKQKEIKVRRWYGNRYGGEVRVMNKWCMNRFIESHVFSMFNVAMGTEAIASQVVLYAIPFAVRGPGSEN